ncbi:Ferrochelatase [Bienertia sinuspersici]
MLSIDENNPAVIQKNEELRHTLESSVLLDIVNPANPDIHACMTKTDFLSLAPKTRFWFNILPFNYINWLIDERKKKKNIESIIAKKETDLEKAKDNPCYDTKKAEWLKEKQKMTYRDSAFFADKCRQSMSEWERKCFQTTVIESSVVVLMVFTIRIEGLFLLLGEVIKTTTIVVFIALKLWNGMTVGMRKSIRLLHFQQYAYTKNLSRCHLAEDLVSYKENIRKQEVFMDCALWSARISFNSRKRERIKKSILKIYELKELRRCFLG